MMWHKEHVYNVIVLQVLLNLATCTSLVQNICLGLYGTYCSTHVTYMTCVIQVTGAEIICRNSSVLYMVPDDLMLVCFHNFHFFD